MLYAALDTWCVLRPSDLLSYLHEPFSKSPVETHAVLVVAKRHPFHVSGPAVDILVRCAPLTDSTNCATY